MEYPWNCVADQKFSEDFFTKRIQELQNQIQSNLPPIDQTDQHAFVGACNMVQACIQSQEEAQKLVDSLHKAKAEKDLIDKAEAALKACEAARDSAEEAAAQVGQKILQSVNVLSSVDEPSLLECTVLIQATPKVLAKWVDEDRPTNETLLESFLGNVEWMKQMMIGGGASNGHYGPAIAIHSQLLKQLAVTSFDNATAPMRHKIALACALEHATPIEVFKDSKTIVDPIDRFWFYVNAYENGELDENFEHFSVWELRMVIDSNATDEDLTWGREYLKAYRPDEVTEKDFAWKYLRSVRTDVGYRHPDHEFQTYKALLSAGGECGPRAFFGRFICKAWGTPTWGVRQPGHAAMSRWTPSGWTVCLGAAFKWSWWEDNRHGSRGSRKGPDFLEETQARAACCPMAYYSRMSVLECLAESLGETIDEHVNPEKIWRSLSLAERRGLASTFNPSSIVAPNASKSSSMADTETWDFVEEIVQKVSGTIIIPATSFIEPAKPDKDKVMTMQSYLGGTQLHLEHDGSVAYKIPPFLPSGSFFLTARVVTVHQVQPPWTLSIEPSRSQETATSVTTTTQITIPYTGGEWQVTDAVKVNLAPGSVLRFSRAAEGCHGLSIKDFTLEPVPEGTI